MPLKEFMTYISQEKGTYHVMQGQRGKTRFGQRVIGRHERRVEARAFTGIPSGKAPEGRV